MPAGREAVLLRQNLGVLVATLAVGLVGCGDNRPARDADRPGPDRIDAAPVDAAVDAVPPDAPQFACTPRGGINPVRQRIAQVGTMPTLVAAPPHDHRLFVIEQAGTMRVIRDGVVVPTPFLDLSAAAGGPVAGGGENGLLGLAFHPRYGENGRFYLFYTIARDGRWASQVVEYRADPTDPDRADPSSRRLLLDLPDRKSNHQGGMLEFGPDGALYISTGDEGGQGDPYENSQNPAALWGKLLRIDVDGADASRPYGIPAGNPFAAGGGAPEVYMLGLRNPWRFSIDPGTGDFYIGDVGGGVIEELDVVPAARAAGANLGWDDCEGSVDFESTGCAAAAAAGRIKPVMEHRHDAVPPFEAIIGGVVYRGRCFPDVVGRYFYTDFYAGGLWSFVYQDGQATDVRSLTYRQGFPTVVSSLHTDAFGEMYLTYRDGGIDRIVFE